MKPAFKDKRDAISGEDTAKSIEPGSIREKAVDLAVTPRTIVGPFMVGGHATIEAGYAVDYELLLKNLAPDCSCLATVRVVSARELPEP